MQKSFTVALCVFAAQGARLQSMSQAENAIQQRLAQMSASIEASGNSSRTWLRLAQVEAESGDEDLGVDEQCYGTDCGGNGTDDEECYGTDCNNNGTDDEDNGTDDEGNYGTGDEDNGTGNEDNGTGGEDNYGTGDEDNGTGNEDNGTGGEDNYGTGDEDNYGTGDEGFVTAYGTDCGTDAECWANKFADMDESDCGTDYGCWERNIAPYEPDCDWDCYIDDLRAELAMYGTGDEAYGTGDEAYGTGDEGAWDESDSDCGTDHGCWERNIAPYEPDCDWDCYIDNLRAELAMYGTGDEGCGTGDERAGTDDEWTGTGDEFAGTGDERAGTGDEWTGTGDEFAGTGDERAGTGDDWQGDLTGQEDCDGTDVECLMRQAGRANLAPKETPEWKKRSPQPKNAEAKADKKAAPPVKVFDEQP